MNPERSGRVVLKCCHSSGKRHTSLFVLVSWSHSLKVECLQRQMLFSSAVSMVPKTVTASPGILNTSIGMQTCGLSWYRQILRTNIVSHWVFYTVTSHNIFHILFDTQAHMVSIFCIQYTHSTHPLIRTCFIIKLEHNVNGLSIGELLSTK